MVYLEKGDGKLNAENQLLHSVIPSQNHTLLSIAPYNQYTHHAPIFTLNIHLLREILVILFHEGEKNLVFWRYWLFTTNFLQRRKVSFKEGIKNIVFLFQGKERNTKLLVIKNWTPGPNGCAITRPWPICLTSARVYQTNEDVYIYTRRIYIYI